MTKLNKVPETAKKRGRKPKGENKFQPLAIPKNVSVALRYKLRFCRRQDGTNNPNLYCKVRVGGKEFTPFSSRYREGTPEAEAWKQSLERRASLIFSDMEFGRAVYSPQEIYELLSGKKQGDAYTLAYWVNLHLTRTDERASVGDLAKRTPLHYRRKVLLLHEAAQLYAPNSSIQSIKADFGQFYLHFLTVTKHYCMAYAKKCIAMGKKIFDMAYQAEVITRNPFGSLERIKLKTKPIEYLTEDELTRLEKTVFTNPTLQLVRDFFMAQCYCGLAYCDLAELTTDDVKDYDGIPSIRVARSKSGTVTAVPIMPPLAAIFERYANTPHQQATGRIIPALSNQKTNQHLKTIAESSGITKNLTTHLGRKTFATMAANSGISEGSLAKSMGHTNTSMTRKHYAHQHEASAVKELFNALKKSV